MSFVDKVKVSVTAGTGGNGKLSFRREKFISKGGPDGGDGGNGGDIVLQASRNQNTLAAFRYNKELKADDGRSGGTNRRHGRSGQDLIVALPVGTVVTSDNGNVMADLTQDGQQEIVALGGKGGFGNAHFTSSRRQTPNFAEKGEPGEEFDLLFELKMIADIGLVGMPNAGKSTLLNKISNARPEVGDYAFTTLTPSLGVVDIDQDTSVLFADIPGLIEGAAKGKGLGHDFLRHIERTAVILHLIDAYNEDVANVYSTIKDELKAYQPDLAKRPEVIVINKIEGLDSEIIQDLVGQLSQVAPKGTAIFGISAHSGEGIKPLLFAIKDIMKKSKPKPKKRTAESDLPVIKLNDKSDAWQVTKTKQGFTVTGQRIEQFANRTDFENDQAVQRLRDIMRRAGILHELARQGIEPEQLIQFGKRSGQSFKY